MSIVFAGLLLGFSLIVAIGPQNLLLIRQGARREHVTAVIAVCLLSDVVLFGLGTLGVGVLIDRAPLLLAALKWAGVAYLAWFALVALIDALRPPRPTLIVEEEPPRSGGGVALATRVRQQAPVATAVIVTWLNPSAYLDSLVMIGGLANQHGDTGRWLFTGGALLASLIWFPLIGYGAGLLSGPLSSPRVWRVLNIIIAVVLAGLAWRLATG
ncbi:LysE/ArgO family amino acid transporter [Corynebacterium sp. YIM 101645]|uniref:LysE/ArgO family amino acid transporter n=1 Tax=Corynebacterium lemuris TaxID=1859292 RepID=A0ABT2FUY3_9CORY|nr:LysE/ArgO family amino acid transporter [Corynebacterium lemuris]MCS5479053.1 LysE/ArgO family amino acid transporter [Corynebacterium lemuris]